MNASPATRPAVSHKTLDGRRVTATETGAGIYALAIDGENVGSVHRIAPGTYICKQRFAPQGYSRSKFRGTLKEAAVEVALVSDSWRAEAAERV